ncbi:MAG TPA: EboA domain-containing protein [Polyangiales bacterium]|nr:EboA domain-containing protein [Polyangiales bacterium]
MRDPKPVGQALLDVAARHMPPEVLQFVRQGVPEAGKPFQRSLFFGYFAGVGRRTRELAFSLSASERSQLVAAGVNVPEAWTLACTVRVALLAFACAALEAREHHGLLKEAYAKGDNGERIAVLRALSLLPDPRRFVDIATEACRTHVQDVFEAVACDNPYAEHYFPDASWNQLVIKALFTDVPLSRLQGLQARKNPELFRMARDYEAERRAASRTISNDLAYVAHALENEP